MYPPDPELVKLQKAINASDVARSALLLISSAPSPSPI